MIATVQVFKSEARRELWASRNRWCSRTNIRACLLAKCSIQQNFNVHSKCANYFLIQTTVHVFNIVYINILNYEHWQLLRAHNIDKYVRNTFNRHFGQLCYGGYRLESSEMTYSSCTKPVDFCEQHSASKILVTREVWTLHYRKNCYQHTDT